MYNNFFSENGVIYEIRWEIGRARQARDETIWRMRFACWVTKITNTHS